MKFLIFNISIVCLIFTAVSCTKEKKPEVNNIKTLGELSYVEAKNEDASLLAEFGNIKITKEEINSKSKVIQELNQQEQSLYSVLVYRMAVNHLNKMVENKEEVLENYDLTIYSGEPKEGFEALANRVKLKLDNRFNVIFAEATDEQMQSKMLGKMDGKTFTYDNIEKNHVRYIEILTQKFDESLRQVKGILTRKLLFADAKAKGTSVQELINTQIIKQEVTLSDEEVVSFMRSKGISDTEMTEQLTTSFRNILHEKKKNGIIGKYVSQNLAKEPIKVYISAPTIEFDIKPDWSPIYGAETAGNSIYYFTNPNCSVCADVKTNIMTALQSNNYDVKLHAFYFFPEWDREARLFSEAAMCVFVQDKVKYWDFHNKLVDYEGKVAESNLYEFANDLALNAETFKSCVLQRKTKDIIDYHLKYADYLGINSQPTLVVKGKIYPGTVSVEKLAQVFGNDLVVSQKPGIIARIINFIKNIFS